MECAQQLDTCPQCRSVILRAALFHVRRRRRSDSLFLYYIPNIAKYTADPHSLQVQVTGTQLYLYLISHICVQFVYMAKRKQYLKLRAVESYKGDAHVVSSVQLEGTSDELISSTLEIIVGVEAPATKSIACWYFTSNSPS